MENGRINEFGVSVRLWVTKDSNDVFPSYSRLHTKKPKYIEIERTLGSWDYGGTVFIEDVIGELSKGIKDGEGFEIEVTIVPIQEIEKPKMIFKSRATYNPDHRLSIMGTVRTGLKPRLRLKVPRKPRGRRKSLHYFQEFHGHKERG